MRAECGGEFVGSLDAALALFEISWWYSLSCPFLSPFLLSAQVHGRGPPTEIAA